ncbi:MAG: hypothetical protein ABI337_05080 [Nitrososphaera sp.]
MYVTGFTDDRSRYRIISKVYMQSNKESVNALHHALKGGCQNRSIWITENSLPQEFKAELARHHIRPIYGRPYQGEEARSKGTTAYCGRR